MAIDAATVRKVARLARIAEPEEKLETLAKELTGIMTWIEQLGELDTDGVEPMSHVFPLVNVFREDEVKPSMARELILQNAPKQKDGCFLVPKTVE